MVGENNSAKSGFGLYTREILSRLHKTGKYEIAELSCFNNGTNDSNVPWKVYPNMPFPDDPPELQKAYGSDGANPFGKWRFDQTVLHFRPDIVFDIRDFWMLEYESLSLLRPYFHWVIAPTVDSLPQQLNWMQTFTTADTVLAHTDWAIDHMKNSSYNINAVTSVSDSVDTNMFSPINYSATFNRAQHFIPQESFIIGSVMRNQKRKLIPSLFKIIKNVREKTQNNNVFLYLHTSYPESSGWDIPTLLNEYQAYNFVLFTYYCHGCSKAYASLFKGASTRCCFCGNKKAHLPNVSKGLSDPQLKNIYNLFDVYVQYAICEGLGIPQLEAASCGVPICSVDYSAMSEVTTKLEGDKIPYVLFKELETGALRAIPDDDATVDVIIKHIQQSSDEKKQNKKQIRKNIIDHYSWDKTAEKYIKIFDSIKPKNMWNVPLRVNPSFHVKAKSHRDMVTTIVKNVIQSPHLLRTTKIQEMIKNLDEGNVSREKIQKNLEDFLNHKILLEKIRSKQVEDSTKYLRYGE